jgi:hypothetical protein
MEMTQMRQWQPDIHRRPWPRLVANLLALLNNPPANIFKANTSLASLSRDAHYSGAIKPLFLQSIVTNKIIVTAIIALSFHNGNTAWKKITAVPIANDRDERYDPPNVSHFT